MTYPKSPQKRKVRIITHIHYFTSTFCIGVKKKHKLTGVAKDLAFALVELEKSAESRYEEREEKSVYVS